MMYKLVNWAFALLLFMTMSAAWAGEYPSGCLPNNVTFQNDEVVLGTAPNSAIYRVYVFGNTSNELVQIDHELPASDLKAKIWQTSLEPEHWSAVLVPENNFPMVCKQSIGDTWSPVACKDVVKVCELRVSEVMLSSRGGYWITQNQPSTSDLFGWIRFQGIYP